MGQTRAVHARGQPGERAGAASRWVGVHRQGLAGEGTEMQELVVLCKGSKDRPQFLLACTGLGMELCMSRIGKKCMETEAGKGKELGAGKLL